MAAFPQQFETYRVKLDQALHEKNKVNELLEKLEKKTGISRIKFVLGILVFLTIYLMFGYGANFICNLLCFVYPAYASIKAIESHNKEDDTKMLTYWVVYSLFSLVEFFFDILLFWIPFYWLVKCLFLVWCFFPMHWNGSQVIYYNIIRPLFFQHTNHIDTAFDEARNAANEAYVNAAASIQQKVLDVTENKSNKEARYVSNNSID